MNDTQVTVQQLKDLADKFITDRNWKQFHSPKNLSMDISIESGELMEKFLWLTTQESIEEIEKNRKEIEDELADVLKGILAFANVANIDLFTALQNKLALSAQKYPIEKAYGRREKYNKL